MSEDTSLCCLCEERRQGNERGHFPMLLAWRTSDAQRNARGQSQNGALLPRSACHSPVSPFPQLVFSTNRFVSLFYTMVSEVVECVPNFRWERGC